MTTTTARPCYHPRSCLACNRLGFACGSHTTQDAGHDRCTGQDPRPVLRTEVSKGYGSTFKTRAAAVREANRWTASGDGGRYLFSRRVNVQPEIPAHYETVTAAAEHVPGGWACCYTTTREYIEE